MSVDDGSSAHDAGNSLRERSPAQTAISEFLHAQSQVPPRTSWARLFGLSPLSNESRHWFWGVIGELEVAEALTHLGEGWTVLHSVPLGGDVADIDHLVIGPAGVFTVTTRNHSAQRVSVSGRAFMVDGHHVPYVRAAEMEVGQAETFLGVAVGDVVTVTAIIAVVDPDALTVRDLPPDVVVLTARQLMKWLVKRSIALPPESVSRLSAVAAAPGTWRCGTAPGVDASGELAEFEAIRREALTARLLRQLWILGGALVLVSVLLGIGYLALAGGR